MAFCVAIVCRSAYLLNNVLYGSEKTGNFGIDDQQYVQVLVNNTTVYILKMFNKG